MKKLAHVVEALYGHFQAELGSPHIVVDKTCRDLVIPTPYAADVKTKVVVFNLDPQAVVNLQFLDSGLSFQARFNAMSFTVWVPYLALVSIYPRGHEEDVVYFNSARVEDASKGQTFLTQSLSFYMQDLTKAEPKDTVVVDRHGIAKAEAGQVGHPKVAVRPGRANLRLVLTNPDEPEKVSASTGKPDLKLM